MWSLMGVGRLRQAVARGGSTVLVISYEGAFTSGHVPEWNLFAAFFQFTLDHTTVRDSLREPPLPNAPGVDKLREEESL